MQGRTIRALPCARRICFGSHGRSAYGADSFRIDKQRHSRRQERGYADGRRGHQQFRIDDEVGASAERKRHRQEHPCDAASAQHRRRRRHRQARQLRRAHLEQSRQVQVRRRHVSDQRPPRDDLGREVLQGFQRPSRQAGPCAGAGAGALCRAGDPRCRGRRRPQRDHRYLRLQRARGRGEPAARRRAEAGDQGNRHRRDRPELPRQPLLRRAHLHQHRRAAGAMVPGPSRSPANPARW